MSVTLDGAVIRLAGDCHVEDAEPLAALLEGHGERTVDLASARRLHSAVVQALLVLRPRVEGEPAEPFLADHLLPALQNAASGTEA